MRKRIYEFCESDLLQTIIILCIIFNVITMAMAYEGSTILYNLILKDINIFFTTIFIVECVLKNISYG